MWEKQKKKKGAKGGKAGGKKNAKAKAPGLFVKKTTTVAPVSPAGDKKEEEVVEGSQDSTPNGVCASTCIST